MIDEPPNAAARLARLERGLQVRLEDDAAGADRDAVVVVAELRRGALPVVRLRDERGVLRTKTVSFVALLSMLDRSCTVDALDDEAERRTALPALPPGTLLVDVVEKPRAKLLILTGYLEPGVRTLVLQQRGATAASVHAVPLPHLVYRAEWSWADRNLRALSVAVCSPDLGGSPTPDTPLFRWPFSNVYPDGGVCWPTMNKLEPVDLSALPDRALERGFLSVPNNADLFGRGRSHVGPHNDYAALLDALADRPAIPRDWLIPTERTVAGLHAAR